jgi:hypothetical protein
MLFLFLFLYKTYTNTSKMSNNFDICIHFWRRTKCLRGSALPSSEFRVPSSEPRGGNIRVPSKEERKTDQRVASEFRVPSKERKKDQRVASESGWQHPSQCGNIRVRVATSEFRVKKKERSEGGNIRSGNIQVPSKEERKRWQHPSSE